MNKEDIKKATLKYCVSNLNGSEPNETVKEIVKQRKETQLKKLKEDDDDILEVQEDDFNDILHKFSKKNTKTYDFLTKAGSKYHTVMFKLCKRIIEKEEIPETFKETTLYMIWKGKTQ